MKYLADARPVDFVTRLETLLPVMDTQAEHDQMNMIILKKYKELSTAQQKRLGATMRKAGIA